MSIDPKRSNAIEPAYLSKEQVFWLGSYPKSGSTWLRVLLEGLLAEPGQSPYRLSAFHNEYPEDRETVTLFGNPVHVTKTHLYPGHRRMSKCPMESMGAITIRRHPLDILLSSMNYAGHKGYSAHFIDRKIKSVEDIIADGEFRFYIDSFADEDGYPWFLGLSGYLSCYMQFWREFGTQKPYLEVCYEDLFADPDAGVREIAGFLGLQRNDRAVDDILKRADLKTARDNAFYWKRRSYNFSKMVPPELIDYFNERCRAQLVGLGYPSDRRDY